MCLMLSSQGVYITHLFRGALDFFGADILFAISVLWVNNLSPVSTNGICGAEMSHQKHRISMLPRKRDFFFLQPFQNSFAGKVEEN